MAERFEKTYISILEFIDSWEKEIYELNQLDYFIFLLINKLGYQIENNFLTSRNRNPYLQIDPDEIGTLAFNIGDSMESFLENNCLDDCSLSCPTKMNEKLSAEEKEYVEKNFHIIHILNEDNWNRRQFLITDILNYVVLDTLFDFYNYDIGVNLEETDIGLLQFADFITDILHNFLLINGQHYLENPKEPAANLFNKLLSEAESSWDDYDNSDLDEELEESEIWKLGQNKITNLVGEFLSNQKDESAVNDYSQRILEYLHNYINNFSGISNVEDFEIQDIEEFVTFWLIRELTLDSFIDLRQALNLYTRFFSWLEFSKEIYLAEMFNQYVEMHYNELQQALNSARMYLQNNSIVNGILEANSSDTDLLDGYFEIVAFTQNGFLRLKDVHLQKIYYNVLMDNKFKDIFLKGNILEGTIKPTAYGWRLINLEYIFPKIASPYLH